MGAQEPRNAQSRFERVFTGPVLEGIAQHCTTYTWLQTMASINRCWRTFASREQRSRKPPMYYVVHQLDNGEEWSLTMCVRCQKYGERIYSNLDENDVRKYNFHCASATCRTHLITHAACSTVIHTRCRAETLDDIRKFRLQGCCAQCQINKTKIMDEMRVYYCDRFVDNAFEGTSVTYVVKTVLPVPSPDGKLICPTCRLIM